MVTQYEREKQLRKSAEQRSIEIEDNFDGEKKETAVKIESLTSIVKMFELKAKNSQDQSEYTLHKEIRKCARTTSTMMTLHIFCVSVARLDDKENEMKKEYQKLHERYTELFKTHIDYMERTKSMLGTERMEQLQSMGTARHKIPGSLAINQANQRSSGPVSFGYSELENNNGQQASILTPGSDFAPQGTTTLKNELQVRLFYIVELLQRYNSKSSRFPSRVPTINHLNSLDRRPPPPQQLKKVRARNYPSVITITKSSSLSNRLVQNAQHRPTSISRKMTSC